MYVIGLTEWSLWLGHAVYNVFYMSPARSTTQVRNGFIDDDFQENKELRSCLEEHQSAIELIMSKYREQVVKLLMHKKLDRSADNNHAEAVCQRFMFTLMFVSPILPLLILVPIVL